jgi:hypothetical protein
MGNIPIEAALLHMSCGMLSSARRREQRLGFPKCSNISKNFRRPLSASQWAETDVAIKSAGVTLLNGDLTGIVRATIVARDHG